MPTALAAAASAAAQSPQADRIVATFTHPTLGVFPEAPCATSPVVSSFTETTPAGLPTGDAGSFDVELQSTCIGAFVQAARQGSSISAQFAFMSGSTPIMTYSLSNATVGQIQLVLRQDGAASVPAIKFGIASPQVSVTYPKAREVSKAEAPIVTQAARVKAPAFQLRSLASLPVTSGEAWATGGVRGALTLSMTTPTLNATFPISDFHVVVPGQVAWLSSGGVQVVHATMNPSAPRAASSLDFTKSVDGSTASLHTAAAARAPVQSATFSLIGSRGATGVTVTVIPGALCLDQTNGTSETLAIAGTVTITDVGSGRKATFQGGMSASGGGHVSAPCA